ncbi:FUSC family protein [Streptomyces sp. NPDC099050]|uniref:FUSC family protein n=1 Tax=Streptomyces sp. NPDC099050 TaxID=3366100 RepID=UPI0037F77EF6
MSRIRSVAVATGASPPSWLVRAVRPRPAQAPPWPAMIRSVIALTAPVAVAVATGNYGVWVMISVGAIAAVLSDTADAYHLRFLNIAVPQFASAVGWLVGASVQGHGWVVVAVMVGVAFVSGFVSSIGPVSSLTGLLFLLMAVIGAGMPVPGPWFQPPLLLMAGGLLVCALSLLGWPLRRHTPQRTAVAAVYHSVADALDAAGTERWSAAMATVAKSVNSAYDLLLLRRARHPGRDPHSRRLLARLNAATPLLEALPAAHGAAQPRTPQAGTAVRTLARAIAEDRPAPWPRLSSGTPEDDALHAALQHATGVHAGTAEAHQPAAGAAGWVTRLRSGARTLFGGGAGLQYGLRLALCIGLAEALVTLVDLPRSYWVALTVTFVLKPDNGSVFTRALLRAAGTLGGVLLAGAVLELVPRGGWELPVIALAALALPLASARSYAFQTASITVLIVLFSDMLGHQGASLVGARVIDTLVAVAIVLTAGYLLWPGARRPRTGARLARSLRDTAAYASLLDPRDKAAAADRSAARRRAYRSLSEVRTAFQQALTEPPPVSTRATAWQPLLLCQERILESLTATATRLDHGATPPPPADSTTVAEALRTLADTIAAPESARTATLRTPAALLTLPDDSPLAGTAAEIHTAFTVTEGPDRVGRASDVPRG